MHTKHTEPLENSFKTTCVYVCKDHNILWWYLMAWYVGMVAMWRRCDELLDSKDGLYAKRYHQVHPRMEATLNQSRDRQ